MKFAFLLTILMFADPARAEWRALQEIHDKNPHTTQVFWVHPTAGAASTAQMFSYVHGAWKSAGPEFPVVVGKGGTVAAELKREGDLKTPEGLYPLARAFARQARPDIQIPLVVLERDDKWIDDPAHPDYNKWIRGATSAKSFENLWRDDHLYDLFLVIGYNEAPTLPGKGSAIFVHLWRSSREGTVGCVAMEKAKLDQLADWLRSGEEPRILIGDRI